jgi:excinuclease ABC subunit A
MSNKTINLLGARVHNLKNIDVTIPRNSLTVITGLSGSGKSSLAFDTIYAEGQRRYIETFSAYARHFIGNIERPDIDEITGLSPVIAIEQ